MAELSTSSPFLAVHDLFFFRGIISDMGGTFNEDLDLYTVDCSDVDYLPPIKFNNLGSGFGLTYYVQPEDYVAKIKRPAAGHS
ncbi:hypothetical protein AAVH_27715 [Aphelenchoides avenae]|nr:hypothetical protein AAVH_27715 [Aphelenchus avenae]